MSAPIQVVPGVGSADIRIRRALAENKRAQILMAVLAASLSGVAVSLLLAAWIETPILIFGALALGAVCHTAIRQFLTMRRHKHVLQSLLLLVRVLPPDEAAQEMMARLRSVRG